MPEHFDPPPPPRASWRFSLFGGESGTFGGGSTHILGGVANFLRETPPPEKGPGLQEALPPSGP